jgi:hypothetical protein
MDPPEIKPCSLKGLSAGLLGPGPIIVSIMEMTIEARDRRGTSHAFAITAMATSAFHGRPWIWRVARIVVHKFPFIK